MPELSIYSFIVNNRVSNIVAHDLDSALNRTQIKFPNSVYAYQGKIEIASLLSQLRAQNMLDVEIVGQEQTKEPKEYQNKSVQDTINFLKVIRDKYGAKSISTIIKDLEYGGNK